MKTMSSLIERAKKRLAQRSKLPPGGKIIEVRCRTCNLIRWYWCGDPALYQAKLLCPQCKT